MALREREERHVVHEEPSGADRASEAAASDRAEARAAEAAATRRRWVTLAEVLAVVAVAISALTLWNSWSERSDNVAARHAEAERASARAATLVLVAAGRGERVLTLKPADGAQSVQSQSIVFPKALGVAPAETTGEPRVEAKWFGDALKQTREAIGLPDDSRGDERLPVIITTRFLVDGEAHEDVALYDVGYTISGRLLTGHSVKLRGLSLVSRVESANARARLDSRWAKLFSAR